MDVKAHIDPRFTLISGCLIAESPGFRVSDFHDRVWSLSRLHAHFGAIH
jgi:hypothetical protein